MLTVIKKQNIKAQKSTTRYVLEYENDETIEKMIRNNVPLDLKHIANIYQHHSSINSEILAEIIQKAILTANDTNYQTNALFILAMVKLPHDQRQLRYFLKNKFKIDANLMLLMLWTQRQNPCSIYLVNILLDCYTVQLMMNGLEIIALWRQFIKGRIRFTNASSIAQERQHLKQRVIIQKHHHSTLITDASRNDSVEPIYYTSLHQTLMVEYNNYKNERASSRGRLFGLKIQSRFRAFLWGTRGVLLSLALAWGYVRLEGIIFMTNFRRNLLQVYLFLLVIILKPINNIGLYLILLQNKLINIFTILIHLRFISIMPCLFFLQFQLQLIHLICLHIVIFIQFISYLICFFFLYRSLVGLHLSNLLFLFGFLLLSLSCLLLSLLLEHYLASLHYLLGSLVNRRLWVFFVEKVTLGICDSEGTQILHFIVNILFLLFEQSGTVFIRTIQAGIYQILNRFIEQFCRAFRGLNRTFNEFFGCFIFRGWFIISYS